MVSEGLCGEDLPQRHRVGVLDLLPHVHQHHALGVHQAETWAEKSREEHNTSEMTQRPAGREIRENNQTLLALQTD